MLVGEALFAIVGFFITCAVAFVRKSSVQITADVCDPPVWLVRPDPQCCALRNKIMFSAHPICVVPGYTAHANVA